MDEIVSKIGRVITTRLGPHDDLLVAIRDIVRRHQIQAGVVLSITGAVTKAVLQKFVDGQQSIGVVELDGPMEVSGHGIVGWVRAPGRGQEPFGVGRYVDGEPYVHVHLTVTSASTTLCGHLMEGCIVRSRHSSSHFTIMVAEIEAAALEMRLDENLESGGKGFGVYHELRQIG
jgi:predicted DNA-binding protein with PD1-like motif